MTVRRRSFYPGLAQPLQRNRSLRRQPTEQTKRNSSRGLWFERKEKEGRRFLRLGNPKGPPAAPARRFCGRRALGGFLSLVLERHPSNDLSSRKRMTAGEHLATISQKGRRLLRPCGNNGNGFGDCPSFRPLCSRRTVIVTWESDHPMCRRFVRRGKAPRGSGTNKIYSRLHQAVSPLLRILRSVKNAVYCDLPVCCFVENREWKSPNQGSSIVSVYFRIQLGGSANGMETGLHRA